MPTTPSERRRLRPVVGAVALLALVPGLGACSGDDPPAPASPSATSETPAPAAGEAVDAPDVARALGRVLARRADAVRRGDEAAFLAGVARRQDVRAAQTDYFANLQALPLGQFGYEPDRRSLTRDGRDYWIDVDVTLELDGFDRQPVVTRDRYRFTPTAGGRYRLSSMTDEAWETSRGVDPQPWESGPLTIRSGAGVLGLFDAGSAKVADRVMREVESGVAAVSAELPYSWDRRVVVYALASPDFLARLDNVPGGDALALDAVTFPVPAAPGSEETAAVRFVLNPRMLAQPDLARGRLIRHELTHVALGDRQDGVPTWLSEGLAEWVSVRPLAPERRAVPQAALDAARGRPTTLPADDTFNGPDSQANYGLSWWACEWLADTWDESVLWLLLDSMRGADDPDAVLQRVLQLDERTLARKSADLMVDTYDPKPSPSPSRSASPSAEPSESGSPSDEPSDEYSGTSDGESR